MPRRRLASWGDWNASSYDPLPPWPPSPPHTPPGVGPYGPTYVDDAVHAFGLVVALGLSGCARYVLAHYAAEAWAEAARLRAARAEVAEAFSPQLRPASPDVQTEGADAEGEEGAPDAEADATRVAE